MFRLTHISDWNLARFWVAFEKVLYFLLLIGILGFIVFQAPRWQATLFPHINEVHLKGYFMHIDRLEVEKMIDAAIKDNFFELDLEKLESDLENIGWVKNAWINRFTPHTLSIVVEEYEAEARWSDDLLIDVEGEIFRPNGFYPTDLPLLNGQYGREKALLAAYRLINEQIEVTGLKIKALREDHRRSLFLTLDNGIALKIGTNNHQARIDQFVTAWEYAAERLSDQVQCLDFRYLNGFAVGWKESEC